MLDVAKVCAPFLAELGFRKRAGNVFTVELDKDVFGWLGLNRATQHRPPGEVEVNPVVGVRHQSVERVVAECRGGRFHGYQPPTVSRAIGYLLPKGRYRAWTFRPEVSEEDVAQEMAAAIKEHGLPFMRSASTLPELCRRLEDRVGFEHQLAYRRPVALLLAGELRRAREDLNESLTRLGNRNDLAAEEFRRFAATLGRRIGLSSTCGR